MKEIDQLTAAIESKQQDRGAIRAQIESFRAQIESIGCRKATLVALRDKRRDALAAAVLDGKEADNRAIDEEIKATQAEAEGDADRLAGLQRAIELQEEKAGTIEQDIRDLTDERKKAAFRVCEAMLAEAEAEIAKLAGKVDGIMQRAVSAATVSRHFGSPALLQHRLVNLVDSVRLGGSEWASRYDYATGSTAALLDDFRKHGATA